MRKKLFSLVIICAVSVVLYSCTSSPTSPAKTPAVFSSYGLFVLNEGNTNYNTTVDFLNLETGSYNSNVLIDNTSIGSNGNDLVQANGDSLYMVMENSNRIYLINDTTGKIIATDSSSSFITPYKMVLLNDSVAAITEFGGNYVTIYNLRTQATLKQIAIGSNPEGLAFDNGKLYVASPGFNSAERLDVVDPVTGSDAIINTDSNVAFVKTLSDTLVAALCTGGYTSVPGAALDLINTTSNTVSTRIPLPESAVKFASDGNLCYVVTATRVLRIDLTTRTIKDTFVASRSYYGITVDTTTHNVFLSDAKDYNSRGELDEYNAAGNLLQSFTCGVNPGTLLVVH